MDVCFAVFSTSLRGVHCPAGIFETLVGGNPGLLVPVNPGYWSKISPKVVPIWTLFTNNYQCIQWIFVLVPVRSELVLLS